MSATGAAAQSTKGPSRKVLSPVIAQMNQPVFQLTLPMPNGKSLTSVVQTANLNLIVHAIIGKPSDDDPVTVAVSLENSFISAGNMFADANNHRGYFQEKVTVRMGLSRNDMISSSDGPQTQNGTASTSSSTTLSFNTNAGVGFFGGTPTGNVGVGAGYSISHSFSGNLSDFTVVNNTRNNIAVHEYIMCTCAGGNAGESGSEYREPTDLIPIDFSHLVSGIVLRKPPALATSNLPLISQASWQANHLKEINDKATLHIEVEQTCRQVWGDFPNLLKISLLLLSGPGGAVALMQQLVSDLHTTAVTLKYHYDLVLPLDELASLAGTVI